MKQITICIIEDHKIFGKAIIEIIKNHFIDKNYNIILFSNAKDFYIYFKEIIPDLVITDISLPDESGLDILKYVKNRNSYIKVLVFTAYDKPSFIYSALKLKADGYITKDISEAEMLLAIDSVLDDKKYFCKNVSDILIEKMIDNEDNKILKESERLNENEILMIQLIAKEYTQDEISLKMNLSSTTLNFYRRHLMIKLNVKNTAGLIRRAFELGILK